MLMHCELDLELVSQVMLTAQLFVIQVLLSSVCDPFH